MNISDIINILYPDTDYIVQDDSNGQGPYIAAWNTDKYPRPTEQELVDRIPEVQAEYDANQTRLTREREYPKIKDQLDMIWHAMDTGKLPQNNEFYTAIKEIKDRNPL